MIQSKDFTNAYGQDIFNTINFACRTQNLPAIAACLVYLVEMCEEVLFFHEKQIKLICSDLYGLTHNREKNSLDLNYLIPQEVLGRELDYDLIYDKVTRFYEKSFNKNTFVNRDIHPLQSVIAQLYQLMGELIEDLDDAKLSKDDIYTLVEYHNRMVGAHLRYRSEHPEIGIDYMSLEEVQEVKKATVYQTLTNEQQMVFAAFIYLKDHGEQFNQGMIKRLTGLTLGEIRNATEYLTTAGFISRSDNQRYYSTEIEFEFLTTQEAANVINVHLYRRTEDLENLSRLEAALLITLLDHTQRVGEGVTINLDVLAEDATGSKSNGAISGAISSLVMRGLLEKDISTKPYTYTVIGVSNRSEIFDNITEEVQSELEAMGYTRPHTPEQIPATQEQTMPVQMEMFADEVPAQQTSDIESLIYGAVQVLKSRHGQATIDAGQIDFSFNSDGFTLQFKRQGND